VTAGVDQLTGEIERRELEVPALGTTVSAAEPSNLKVYLFGPAASMTIRSAIMLRETSSFHFPTNGSLAVQTLDIAKQAIANDPPICIDLGSSD
jgi:hypothetical protein